MPDEPGLPTWADLSTTDLRGAVDYYSKLFGWTPEVATEPEAQGYTRFMIDGKAVAGAGPIMGEGQPTAWTTYFATTDADAVADKVQLAGGTVLMPPMDVMSYGRMATFMDPTGAVFAVWQAGEHGGAEVMHQPGSYDWTELMTRDPEAAGSFYADVFGWTAERLEIGDVAYTVFNLGEHAAGGMIAMEGPAWSPQIPPHWTVYFSVADCDATCDHAQRLGGRVSAPPTDIPPGRYAVLGDPQGAFFSVIQNNPEYAM